MEKKTERKCHYEELEQFDYIDGDYLDKVFRKYVSQIGLFLIKFSVLEHELNLAIADILGDDYHETGYVIIEKLTTSNKIDLFYKMYARFHSCIDKYNNKEMLNIIVKQLDSLNMFRNNIVHANWQSLTKDGLVRTKIIVDNQEGFVKFKKIEITPNVIRSRIKEIDSLIESIDKYKEVAFTLLYR